MNLRQSGIPTQTTLGGLATRRAWNDLAESAEFRRSTLARLCNVSIRTLDRYFLQHRNQTVRCWMNELRMKLAWERLETAESVKRVAIGLNYKQASHFSREFKGRFGISPNDRLGGVIGSNRMWMGKTPDGAARERLACFRKMIIPEPPPESQVLSHHPARDAIPQTRALRKFVAAAQPGRSTYRIAHNLQSEDVIVQMRIAGRIREGGVSIVDANVVQLTFGGVLNEAMDVVIIG